MNKKFFYRLIIIMTLCLAAVLPVTLFPGIAKAAGDTVYVYQDITTNTTWNSGNTYVICEVPGTSRGPQVMPGVTLTIESGATVSLDDNRVYIGSGIDTYTTGTMYVYGTINATGATFTARTDKWSNIVLKANDTASLTVNATFTDCIFEKGGNSGAAMILVQENVNLEPSDGQTVNLTVSGCTFQNSSNNGMGIYATIGHHTCAEGIYNISNTTFNNLGCAVDILRNYQDDIDVSIDNCTFSNLHGAGVIVEDCRNVSVTDSAFSNIGAPAGTGIPLVLGYNYADSDYWGGYAKGNVTVTGNTFTGTADTTAYPIQIHAAAKINSGIESPGNVFPGYPNAMKFAYIFLDVRDADAVWGNVGLPYLLDNRVDVGLAADSETDPGSLAIDPGITVTMRNSGEIYVYTAFSASGTEAKPINFNAIAPKSEYNQICIVPCRKDFTMKHCVLDGMQNGVFGGTHYGTDGIDSFTIEGCTFKNMAKTGVSFTNTGITATGNAVIRNSVFDNNGEHGLYVSYAPALLEVYNSVFSNNAKDGVYLFEVTHLTMDHCMIHSNGYDGVMVQDTTDAANAPSLTNCTVAANGRYGIFNRDVGAPYGVFVQGATLYNTIVSGNGIEDMLNDGYVEWDGARITYSCITTSWNNYHDGVSTLGTGCIRKDALFADIANDDFHLKSDGGRWNKTAWVTDAVTSQCIDAGDPASDYANEPTANGGCVNMGYYGNTADASKAHVTALDTTAPDWATGAALTASNITSSSADLAWTALPDAAIYRIFKNQSSYGYGEWVAVKDTTGTSCTVTGDFDWGYYYKVEAMDAAGNWTTTGPKRYVRVPDTTAPTWGSSPLTASSITENSITLSWKGAFDDWGLNKCRIYKNGNQIGEVDYFAVDANDDYDGQYTVTGLAAATNYTFKVEADDPSGNWSTNGPSAVVVTAGVDTTAPAWGAGSSLTASNTTQTGTKLSWPAATDSIGVTAYKVYKNGAKIASTANTSYTVTNLAASTSYTFKIEAGDAAGNWSVSGPTLILKTLATPVPPAPASVNAASAGYSSIKITWTTASGANGYEVYRATSSTGTYIIVYTATSGTVLNYTNANLITGKAYYYKVRAYTNSGTTKVYGSFSAVKSAKPSLNAVSGAKAVRVSSSSIKITWNAVSGRTAYQLYRATSARGTYSLVKTTTSTYYKNTRLKKGKTYYYKVRAYRLVGTNKVYGRYSVVVSAKL